MSILVQAQSRQQYLTQIRHQSGGIFQLGAGNAPGRVLHNPMFDFPDESLAVGVAAMTAFALEQCR